MKGGFGCSPCCGGFTCWDGCSLTSGADAFNSQDFMAGGFVTGSSGMSLTSVVIYNSGYDEPLVAKPGGGYTNNPVCRIHTSTATPQPDALLATLTAPASFSGATWTYTHAGLSLSANTTYWVVMCCPFPSTQTGYWNYGLYGCAIDLPNGCWFRSSYSLNSGGLWTGSKENYYYLFDVA